MGEMVRVVRSTQGDIAYLIARFVLQNGCPRCGYVKRHHKDCVLGKLIIKYESQLAHLPDTAFE